MLYLLISALPQRDIRDFAPEYMAALAPPKRAEWRPYVEDAQPAETATQVTVDAGIVVSDVEARRRWALRPKTQEELDVEASRTEAPVLRQMIAALTSSIQSPDTSGTAAERLTKLEARVLRIERIARHYVRSVSSV